MKVNFYRDSAWLDKAEPNPCRNYHENMSHSCLRFNTATKGTFFFYLILRNKHNRIFREMKKLNFHLQRTLYIRFTIWININRYLVSADWFKQWKKYVGFDYWNKTCKGARDCDAYPGPIDNSALQEGNLVSEYTLLKCKR